MAKLIAVGLILALGCCQALLSEAALDGATPLVDEWMKQYGDVFAEIRKSVPALSSFEIIQRLGWMRSHMDQVRDNQWIREHMIHAVNTWFGAITDKNASHCNIHHFNDINYELHSIINMRVPPTNNKDQLFEMFYSYTGNFCRKVLADSLSSSLGNQTINDLKNIKLAHDSSVAGNITKKELAKRVFGLLNLQKSSTKEEIIDLWLHGPCDRLQPVIESPDNRATYRLVRQKELREQTELSPEQETIDFFFGMERVCYELNTMVDELATDYASGIMSQLGRLFGKHSIS